jgi:hypothetical protein
VPCSREAAAGFSRPDSAPGFSRGKAAPLPPISPALTDEEKEGDMGVVRHPHLKVRALAGRLKPTPQAMPLAQCVL